MIHFESHILILKFVSNNPSQNSFISKGNILLINIKNGRNDLRGK